MSVSDATRAANSEEFKSAICQMFTQPSGTPAAFCNAQLQVVGRRRLQAGGPTLGTIQADYTIRIPAGERSATKKISKSLMASIKSMGDSAQATAKTSQRLQEIVNAAMSDSSEVRYNWQVRLKPDDEDFVPAALTNETAWIYGMPSWRVRMMNDSQPVYSVQASYRFMRFVPGQTLISALATDLGVGPGDVALEPDGRSVWNVKILAGRNESQMASLLSQMRAPQHLDEVRRLTNRLVNWEVLPMGVVLPEMGLRGTTISILGMPSSYTLKHLKNELGYVSVESLGATEHEVPPINPQPGFQVSIYSFSKPVLLEVPVEKPVVPVLFDVIPRPNATVVPGPYVFGEATAKASTVVVFIAALGAVGCLGSCFLGIWVLKKFKTQKRGKFAEQEQEVLELAPEEPPPQAEEDETFDVPAMDEFDAGGPVQVRTAAVHVVLRPEVMGSLESA